MRPRVLLLVDLSYHVYRAAAAHPMLSSDGVFTGGLYGFFQSFAKAVRDTQATHVAICQDSKPYLRSRDYPDYKKLRKKAADEDLLERYTASTPLVLDALSAIGIKPWGVPGFEADDMIGWAAITQRHRFTRIIAGSNDSDLYQLFVLPNFATFNNEVKEAWDGERLARDLGLTPAEFMLATALQGTHNDIAGIEGVGVKKSRAAAKDPALLRPLMSKHGDIVQRNLDLIRLPHREFPGSVMPPIRESTARDMYRALGRYDIEVTASMIAALDQIQPRR